MVSLPIPDLTKTKPTPIAIAWMASAAQSAAHTVHLKSWSQCEFSSMTAAATMQQRTDQSNTMMTRSLRVTPAGTRGNLAISMIDENGHP